MGAVLRRARPALWNTRYEVDTHSEHLFSGCSHGEKPDVQPVIPTGSS